MRPVPVLRLARVAHGWTQADLARESGLSPGTISRLENGHELPLKRTVQRLAAVLAFPAGLLFPEGDRFPTNNEAAVPTAASKRNGATPPHAEE